MRVRTHTNPFNYYERMEPTPLDSIFPDFSGSLDIEIGFGRGIFLRHYANAHPERHIIGVEVRKSIVDILQERIDNETQIQNVHLIHGNGEIVVEDMLEDHVIENIFVFHPDPWFKKRHHKRRVINPKFLNILTKKLKKDGVLHLSTDAETLWNDMRDTINESNVFEIIDNHPFWESDYTSHWDNFSQKDQRSLFRASFKLA